MNKKKILSAIIAASLAVSPMAVFAENDTPVDSAPAVIAPIDAEEAPVFMSESMTVESVEGDNVVLKGEQDSIINLSISKDTLIIDGEGNRVKEIKKDDSITYYVASNKPTLLIYPPVYTPDVVVVNAKDGENKSSVKVDRFKLEENALISADGALVLNIDPAVLENADGSKVTKESLDGKCLCVVYSMTTMSLPPQTSPDKVYILNSIEEEIELPPEILADSTAVPEVTNEICANGGEKFNVTLVEINGRQMLPVRAVSEALGLEVSYDDAMQAITVGTIPMGVNFNIGADLYNKARMTPFTLGQAPVKVIFEETGVTYVPVEFFTEVLGAEITVDNGTTLINRA